VLCAVPLAQATPGSDILILFSCTVRYVARPEQGVGTVLVLSIRTGRKAAASCYLDCGFMRHKLKLGQPSTNTGAIAGSCAGCVPARCDRGLSSTSSPSFIAPALRVNSSLTCPERSRKVTTYHSRTTSFLIDTPAIRIRYNVRRMNNITFSNRHSSGTFSVPLSVPAR
jgi:hypothetical protein